VLTKLFPILNAQKGSTQIAILGLITIPHLTLFDSSVVICSLKYNLLHALTYLHVKEIFLSEPQYIRG
jgi:hypothetical protein